MLNDPSRHLDDIFTIEKSQFEKYISGKYPAEPQLTNENSFPKETPFLDSNIKMIGYDMHIRFYDEFRFPIFNFHWLSGDILRFQLGNYLCKHG